MTEGVVPVGDALAVILAANGWADVEDVTEARETLGEDADDAAVVQHLVAHGRMTGTQVSDLEQILAQQKHLPNFQVLRKIGSGGMGVVYFARHLATGRTCALKTINARLAEDQDTVNRFRRETETLSAISHENIAEVVDVGEMNGHVYLAMQYIDGPNLGSLLKDHEKIPELYALRIMRQITDGLSYVYSAAGLIHRDIKPENVLMMRHDGNAAVAFPPDDVAKLIDFGLVKSMDDRQLNLTQTGMTIGTPLYMSPEQVRGDPLDCRSDFYGVAATLYHLVTGSAPYPGMSPGAIMSAHLTRPIPDPKVKLPTIHAMTQTVIMTGMAKDFHERYRHYDDFIAALDKAIAAVAERDAPVAAESAAPVEEEAEAKPVAAGHDDHGHGGPVASPPEVVESGRFRPTVTVELPNIEHLATGSAAGPSPVAAAPAAKAAPAAPARPHAPQGSGPSGIPGVQKPANQPGRTAGRTSAAGAGAPPGVRASRPQASAPAEAAAAPAAHGTQAPVLAGSATASMPRPGVDLPSVGQTAPASADLPSTPAPVTGSVQKPKALAPPGTGLGATARGDLVVATGSEDGATGTARVGTATGSGRAIGSASGTGSTSGTGNAPRMGSATGTGGAGSATGTARAKAPAPVPAPPKESELVAVKALELELSQAKHVPQTSYLPWICLAVVVVVLVALLAFGVIG